MLEGKTIVITGASSGIGRATAELARAQGASIIEVDIQPPRQTIGQFIAADLSDRVSIEHLISTLPSGINGLVNCAGLPPTQPAAQVLKVNLVGLKCLTTGLIDKLADGASIVNVASLAGLGWIEAQAKAAIEASADLGFDDVDAFCQQHAIDDARSYFFSKEALIVWTLQNRWTWRQRDIRMNAISPGPVDTPILPDFVQTLGARAEEDLRDVGRPGTAAEIAPLVCFLLSDSSKWIRGTNIPVDGGMFSQILLQRHGFLEQK